ncbi:hypothetical protein DFO67_13319 [Modicisalibacter xianhensis]|uniref:Uncharacterized protein n=1 Tax=Modicisalibacter xianhensis TaxID=442341 RepID=A0A4R8F9H4_9GAMM|nr:hypothetical protein [Halomonas xianhensis]TDX21862.1 hypothetical protein DFO67_13319 [Halomonas xianhensis]
MPKLKSIDFQGRSACGDTLAFTSQVTVSADGIFAATVPEEIASAINSLRAKGTQQDVWTDQPRTNHRAVSKDLEKLKRAIKAGIDEHLSVETVVERVIVYAVNIDVSAWEDSCGGLHANGYVGGTRGEEGRWHPMGNHLHASSHTPYFRVGLYARVYDLKTYRRNNSQRQEFCRPEWDHHHLEYPTYGSKLNGFATLGASSLKPDEMKRMPYTEEAARFFYEMLLAICYLGRNLHDFFSDESNIKLAIESGGAPLLVQAGR